ncbi:MAG: hypothetical protein K8R19_05975 [Methanosarcinales archaeon]|nr:hypothetical protein [Methanosarcinales archaeon]
MKYIIYAMLSFLINILRSSAALGVTSQRLTYREKKITGIIYPLNVKKMLTLFVFSKPA